MTKMKVLIADDDPFVFDVIESILLNANYIPICVSHGNEIIPKVKEEMPDVILLDLMMPGMDGFEVKRKLNEDKSTKTIPVIFVTAIDGTEDKIAGLNLGAYDYITKPFDMHELLARIESVLNRKKYYEDISMKDEVTGLYNMHYFRPQMKLFFDIAKRYKKVFSLVIVDIDDFKKINDLQGHAGGDIVLKNVSAILNDSLRRSDILARYGGDEFIIILPETGEVKARMVMSKIREKISEEVFVVDKANKKIPVFVSVGVSEYSDSFKTELQLFEKADMDMYEDKKAKAKRALNTPKTSPGEPSPKI